MAKNLITPRWRSVKDFPNYKISSDGQVWSQPRRNTRGGLLKPFPIAKGYLRVELRNETRQKGYLVHLLVLEAFVGPCPPGIQARHRNGNPTDNRLSNLHWGTGSENQFDSIAHGTHPQASKTHCKAGHEYTEENIYRPPSGERACRICRSARKRTRRALFCQGVASANRTHCPAGHEYTTENTYIHPAGYRTCRVCRTEQKRARRERLKHELMSAPDG